MTMLPSGIRDNRRRGSVADFLRAHLRMGSAVSIVSAYFTVYAYAALETDLDHIGELRFLYGEPRFIKAVDPKSDGQAYEIGEQGLTLAQRLHQRRVARACADWIRERVDVRSVRESNLLHGKLYHIDNAGVANAILGSSNFTVRGLGLDAGERNNIELNLIVDSDRDRRDLKAWFDELWNDPQRVVDVKADLLGYLAKLYADHDPQFIYYKTLFHVFEAYLADQERGGLIDDRVRLTDSQIWQTLFDFQKDGVKGAINKILRHNGCIIADSVGLGKTYEALAIIKYFELLNQRVLVLCPKKLRENWTVYQAANGSALNPFPRDRFAYTVLSHTDLSRSDGRVGDIDLATLNWGNYDLVVIDESHNFRNDTKGARDEDGQRIRKSRYERLMEDIIQAGVKTRVLLLSATPVNNSLRDLRNQIAFMTEGRDDAFAASMGIDSLTNSMAGAQTAFTNWAKREPRQVEALLEALSAGFFKLLDELTIARSRKHIQRYYGDTIAQIGGFPQRLKPISRATAIDVRDRFPTYDRLNRDISEYRLALFNPSAYLRPEFAHLYDTTAIPAFSQARREHYLIGMMKVNFLKRLESSVHAFRITLARTVEKIEALETRIERFRALAESNAEIELSDLDVADVDDEELLAALQVGRRLTFNLAHLDIDAWQHDLREDRLNLYNLQLSAADVSAARDAKLAELKALIRHKVLQPTALRDGTPNRKVLVFTAFADTATYLYDQLVAWARETLDIHVALVTGGGSGDRATLGRARYNDILTNFAPRAKRRAQIPGLPQDAEIDLLIATDCISEGQNLQDCDYLVNYDIHWNPVRIIQRFGRIDRIGSQNAAVQLVNFWPTDDLDQYISLKNRVEARMALVDVAATAEDNLLQDVEDLIKEDLKYRDKQLKRLRDEVLDMEDFNESVALTDFTLDDFRADLLRYLAANRQKLAGAPLGLFSVVPAPDGHALIRPGIVFCLRQSAVPPDERRSEINPLQPYYLVYVRDDGEVRLGFAQPKQVLQLMRILCADAPRVHQVLADAFDQVTDNGRDMRFANGLLTAAVQSIARTFTRRAAATLTTSRSAVLPTLAAQPAAASDLELITWLVIR